jgi:hypothetical protein
MNNATVSDTEVSFAASLYEALHRFKWRRRSYAASPHIESALTEQNEINEAPAKSRGDRPNRRIKAVVGRLNMH